MQLNTWGQGNQADECINIIVLFMIYIKQSRTSRDEERRRYMLRELTTNSSVAQYNLKKAYISNTIMRKHEIKTGDYTQHYDINWE